MFKFIVQNNKKYLVMKVSKKLYNSRLYSILQIIVIAIVLTFFTVPHSLPISSAVTMFLVTVSVFYIIKLTAITILFRHKLSSEMEGLNFFFPSKMVWYRSLCLVLQNRFMLFYITEMDNDPFSYYKPILCFWRKGCHICKDHNIFQ